MQDNELYAKYNYDNVFNRVVIIGLLNLLNNDLSYEQIWDTNIVEKVHVPFMYDFGSSDERFAQDNYTFFGRACFGEKKIDGKFDMLPRGAIKYTGSQIDNANFTHKYIKSKYLKDENGRLTSYIGYMCSIPLTFTFECEMWIDNMDTAFKIEQGLRDTFYKNKRYDVLYKGLKVPCRAGFPESHALEKTVSYSFDAERQMKLTFTIAVETYQPSFYQNDDDHDTLEIDASKTIEGLAWDIELKDYSNIIQNVKLEPIDTSIVYPSGTNMIIKWTTFSNISEMCTIILSWIDENGKHHFIDSPRINSGIATWTIPSDFSNFIHPTVVFNDITKIIEMPNIIIVPNNDKIIDASSFIVMNGGKFYKNANGSDTYLIEASIEYLDSNGTLHFSNSYKFNVINGSISETEPVVIDGDYLVYTEEMKPRKISLQLTYPLNTSINDKIDNILIL